ncbi:hypothetical protein BC831DRAFT_464897 [Entophlyctis helioformis]|nr:hypothetical protein BC831DRAFT_464897 [Entophlyctis helioformis]
MTSAARLPFKPIPQLPPAPASFYLRTFGIGLVVGALLEVTMIKTGYYGMLAMGEAKKRAKQAAEDKERQALQSITPTTTATPTTPSA